MNVFDKYNMLFWVLVATTIITVVLSMFMMYRMSHRPIPRSITNPTPSTAPSPPPTKPPSKPVVETYDATSSGKIVYIYSSRCGWCDRFNPIWDDFLKAYNGGIPTLKVEAGDKDAQNYKVSGYPTVLYVDSNGAKTFERERTVENLLAFANSL